MNLNTQTNPINISYDNLYNEIRTMASGDGSFSVPANNPNAPEEFFFARQFFEPLHRDVNYSGTSCILYVVNATRHPLNLKNRKPSHVRGGSLVSAPLVEDGTRDVLGRIPPLHDASRTSYMGAGRFVHDNGSFVHGTGGALTFETADPAIETTFTIFYSVSWKGGFGLDISADDTGVDISTRFRNGAGKNKWEPGFFCQDSTHRLRVCASISSQYQRPDEANDRNALVVALIEDVF